MCSLENNYLCFTLFISFRKNSHVLVIYTEVNNSQIGATLYYKTGVSHNFSVHRSLSVEEQNFPTIQLELVAINFAYQQLEYYMHGHSVFHLSDCEHLAYILN